MTTVVCKNCNRTSVAVTKAYAEAEIDRFNAYYDTLTAEQQQSNYGGKPSTLTNYTCFCGGTEFEPGDTSRVGNTLNPVIYEGTEL